MEFLNYVLNEVKNQRLGKAQAISLIRQYKTQAAPQELPVLHPLLQRNTSDLLEQRFSTRLTGDEFFLADHVVQGRRVLPGVAYLEMAREALVRGAGLAAEAGVRLRDVVWERPLVVEAAPVEVHVALVAADGGGAVGFEIYGGEETVHCRGDVESFTPGDAPPLDLAALRAQCDRAALSGADCYARYAALGLAYGPAHQPIETVHVGAGLALARLVLPASVAATGPDYVLHPSLLDGALQAVAGLAFEDPQGGLALPFAVHEVEILGRCQGSMWALVQPSAGAGAQDKVRQTDITLCGDDGVVAVRLKGFAARVVEGALGAAARDGLAPARVLEGAPDGIGRGQATQAATVPAAQAPAASAPRPGAAGLDEAQLRALALPYFKRLLARVFKLPPERIDAEAPLERYGIDSILVTQLTAELENDFGRLSKTLLFEHQTLDALVGHFMARHREALVGLLAPAAEAGAAPVQAGPAPLAAAPVPRPSRRRRGRSGGPQGAAGAAARGGIAVIGVAGRYPQARDLKAFWHNLREGRDCVTEIPPERWDHSLYFDPDKNKLGTVYGKWGGFIEGVDEFDPQFFNMSPREAEFIDPQERLFLQCVHAALEDAGYTRETLGRCSPQRSVGVYAGVFFEEYQLLGAQEQARGNRVALSGSPASIANRVSYWFNLHGPSLSVDSMCSSSLTAIHLACDALLHGQCELAIAGGVNVTIHPNKYLLLSQSRFISSKGRCESFGEGGDGYVPAEGVGALILKPLERAIADGDQIYGVIRASALNHGGKTNGYTVPNPLAQAGVIGRALQDSGFDARSIGYIEAHGTGTSLGDPIEIAGLSQAFGEHTSDRQFCAIGSLKSNIGHGEAVAGVAGVTKVLLQMKHGQLVPSLHSRTLNPNIDFATTPFVVQQQLAEWVRPVLEIDGRRVELPRRAGVSSFGAGGSNAHLLIEELMAPPRPDEDAPSEGPVAVVLSARDEERLREQARQLADFLADEEGAAARLADIAYTLQVGREAMAERLALLVRSPGELRERLAAWLNGRTEVEGLFRGRGDRGREALAAGADEDRAGTVEGWIATGRLEQLLALWVQGWPLDWNRLYGPRQPRRISLPTYPFARERYWVPQAETPASAQGAAGGLHPLVQRNSSNLYELRFSSRFGGGEFFLADHVVQGRRVLPGVAYLEMAREALVQAGGADVGGGVRLKDVVWARPVVADAPVELHVGLDLEADGTVGFEIYSGEDVVHSQGRCEPLAAGPAERLDLAALRAQCDRARLEGAECYRGFAALGLAYGPAQQAIETLHLGTGQVLARLVLPAPVAGTAGDYVLHPSLLDAALQAVAGLAAGEAPGRLALPFAVEAMEVVGRCSARMWALVRHSAGSRAQDAVRKADITLCDDEGHVVVRIRGYASRVVEGQLGGAGVLLLQPRWREQPTAAGAAPRYAERHVLLCGVGVEAADLRVRLGDAACAELPAGADLAAGFGEAARWLCAQVQDILSRKPTAPVLLQVVVPAQGERQVLAGLAGVLRTARLEQPQLVGQLLAVGEDEEAAGLAAKLAQNATAVQDVEVRWVGARREVTHWEEITAEAEALVPWRERGVYLVTGGLGGLGGLFAKEIAQRAPGATLVLTGRRALDEAAREQLRALQALGARAEYRAVDVADAEAVRRLVLEVLEAHQALHGIVHSAGVLRDGLLLRKTAQDVDAVLAPKVAGLLNLDAASRDAALDWLLCFSSFSGALGNVGQADYAAANAFMDRFVLHRNALAARGLRHGRALSLNWPLWREGGMHIDAAAEARMEQLTGMKALGTAAGIAALYRVLGLAGRDGLAQAMVLEGTPGTLRRWIASWAAPAPAAVQPPAGAGAAAQPGAAGDEALRDKALQHLRRMLAKVFRMPAERLEAEVPLERYGIDSVMAMQLTAELEKAFGPLPKTLLFEHQTLGALAGHFLDAHRERLAQLLQVQAPAASVPAAAAAPGATVLPGPVPARRRRGRGAPQPGAAARGEAGRAPRGGALDVAIVGLSGRYAQARNLDELWANLRAGRHCITEVPAERWDHRLYFDPQRGQPGKAYSKWGGFLEGADRFDPLFFNIAPREAELMDPQERLFLEQAYASIEDAGYTPASLSSGGKVGVFAGVMNAHYAGGARFWSIANRVSYLFNFQGPSLAVDTACSSSLTALHLALESLRSGGCDVAVAGGVNLIIDPAQYLALSAMNMLSAGERCRAFGDQADGFVDGEGVGAAVLKPLERALADGDQVYGVIKASAINHGGKTNGYTVPNPLAQAGVIGQVLQDAGVDPRSIGYVEAHGTGTALGDPIEIAGLSRAFGAHTAQRQFCAIGSLKSNIGHCESAAGIAALSKVLLQLRHGELVPSLHSEQLNPHIDFAATPFVVQRELAPWRRPVVEVDGRPVELPRRAGISSFGAGGSNAHLLIEEHIAPPAPEAARAPWASQPALVVLSGRNEERLRERAQQLLEAIRAHGWGDERLADLAYTLQVGREAMEERLALVAGSMAELQARLAAYLAGEEGIEELFRGQVKRNKETMAIFAATEELQEAVAKWLERRKFSKVLDLWVRGLALDWQLLYGAPGEARPRRMSLPTYPFARERYWLRRDAAASAAAPVKQAGATAPAPAAGLSLLAPVWEPAQPPAGTPAVPAGGVLIVGGTPLQQELLRRHHPQAQVADFAPGAGIEEIAAALAAQEPFGQLVWIAPEGASVQVADEAMIAAQREGVLHGFRLVKALLEAGYGSRPLAWSVFTTQTVAVREGEALLPAHAGIHGLLGALAKEHPNWPLRLADLPLGEPWPWAEALALPADPQGTPWAWRGGQWFRPQLRPAAAASAAPPYRQGGVYVLIGGAGGIGEAWSEHLIRHHRAQVVWIGRRALDADIQARIDRLAQCGPAPLYIAADATDRAALQRARDEVRQRFGALHGVLHSALVLNDQGLAKLEEARFAASLAAKVDVSVRLAQVFAGEALDFVLFFSSLQSFVRSPGQSGYAAGCVFKDAFAQRLGQLWPCPVKVMNWGWWGSVGVAVGDHYQARMRQLGLASIEPEEGWAALAQLLGGRHGQLALAKTAAQGAGEAPQGTAAGAPATARVPVPVPAGTALDDESLRRLGVAALRQLVGGLLHVPQERIDASESLAAYGIDSISVNQLSGLLSSAFAGVSSALFYDCQSIDALIGHFLATQREALAAWVATGATGATGVAPQLAPVAEGPVPAAAPAPAALRQERPAAASVVVLPPAAGGARAGEVAIVGMACRFPGADSVEAYWQLLLDGTRADNRGPARRWPGQAAGQDTAASWGAFLEGVEQFDPGFFGIPALQAEVIDPQERLFLTSAWQALEDAGYASDKALAERARRGEDVGVFVGVTAASYNLVGFESSLAGQPRATNLSFASVANRVSHALGLTGPSLAVDTMCSSSLVALHMACESLRRQECALAIAGGVNLNLHPARLQGLAQAGLASPDGRSRSFGAGGRGFLAAEGVAALVLKPLEAALRDGDTVHAVIRASAVGHSGSTLSYFTPSVRGQGQVIAKALRGAGLCADEVDYVEMQCVGDEATDAAEFEALKAAYQTRQRRGAPLRVGSVKPNVGHAEAAAAMAQLIKTVLQLRHRSFVPTLVDGERNPQLHLDGAQVLIQQAREALPAGPGGRAPLRAAVNAFGAGGTAAHVIVEAAPLVPSAPAGDGPQLLPLSARSRPALRRTAEALAQWLAQAPQPDAPVCLADVAYTLQVGRRELGHRLAFTASSAAQALAALRGWLDGDGTAQLPCSPEDGAAPAAADPATVQALAAAKDLNGLARLWVKGVSIDWRTHLGAAGARRRVPLPGTALEPRPFWPAAVGAGAAPATLQAKPAQAQTQANANANAGAGAGAGAQGTAAPATRAQAQAARPAPARTDAGLLQSIVTAQDVAPCLQAQARNIADKLQLATAGILYAVMKDKGVAFEEGRTTEGGLALYPRLPAGAAASAERLLAQLEGRVDERALGLRERLEARALQLAGRLMERFPAIAGEGGATARLLRRLPGGSGVMAAFLLKRLAATPFVVQDAGGVRLVLPAGIRSRKELELLGAQYELGLRALPEYRPYCELLFAVVGGILDGVRPQAEHMAAAHALLAGMLGAPSKLDFLGRLAGELCFAGRFEGRERLSVLLLGAGGLEPLAALVEAAPGAHIEARVVSGWPQVAQALAERGRERFPGVRFVASAPLVPGALAQRLEGSRFDAVVVHTQDPCAHEAAALLAQRAEAGVGDPLVLMVEGIESRGLHLVLELTGLWPRIAAQHALPDAAALAEALERAGYRRQTLAASLLSVFSLEPEDGGDGGGDGSEDAQREDIDSFLRQTFADAVDDGTALDPAADLAEAGLSSMSWTLVYARLEQRFGEAVDAGLFGTEEGPLSVDTLAARLWQRLRVSRPVAPLPQDLADRVGQRLVAVSRMEVALEHAARLRRHEITSRRGQRWEVYEGGSGPALIFLTAMAFGMPVWENQIRALAPGYRLVFPHLPGHAGSVCTGKGFSFENLADDLVELMDALGIGQAHLVGWCMAGNIAQLVALRHPRRLKSLTLVCTTPTDARMRGLSQKDLEEYAESPLLTYQMEFSNIYQGELLAPEVSRSMATIKASHVPVDPHAMLSFVGSLFKFDTRERLRQIGLPTLVIAGRRDIAFPVEQVALLAQGIPQARLVIFERGGHLPFLNQSEAFNETLRTFLADAASVRSGGARRHEPAPPDAGETREVVC